MKDPIINSAASAFYICAFVIREAAASALRRLADRVDVPGSDHQQRRLALELRILQLADEQSRLEQLFRGGPKPATFVQ
jgi:hypothetical protein